MAGRPRKITPEVEEQFLSLIEEGVTQADACAACGISDQTILRHKTHSVDFVERMKKADAVASITAVRAVRGAFDTSWQAAAWWLERKRREEFGRVEKPDPAKDSQQSQDEPKWNLEVLSTDDIRELYRMQVAATKNGNGTG